MNQPHTPLEKTKAYVDASNNHDLATIAPMLSEDCRYVSSGVGEFVGREPILQMMKTFFAANPDVRWKVPEYRLDTENRVEFDFSISLGGQSSQGIEKISFDSDGNINLVEVVR